MVEMVEYTVQFMACILAMMNAVVSFWVLPNAPSVKAAGLPFKLMVLLRVNAFYCWSEINFRRCACTRMRFGILLLMLLASLDRDWLFHLAYDFLSYDLHSTQSIWTDHDGSSSLCFSWSSFLKISTWLEAVVFVGLSFCHWNQLSSCIKSWIDCGSGGNVSQ